MTFERKDVSKLGSDWSDTLVWYAMAVGKLQERPLASRTSWRFLAAMHGFNEVLWSAHGYYSSGEALPSDSDRARFWDQCQHQSWYFLPWHRGYLASFESIVRSAVVELGGPADWSLPYWNYFDPDSRSVPPAFLQKTMPDGSPNHLFVEARYGDGHGNFIIEPEDVSLNALKDHAFIGGDSGGNSGFGGPDTKFNHGKGVNGHLESDPHNTVHGLVGGLEDEKHPDDRTTYGLMSIPATAALDPIFWLHHANIDRLWEVWRKRDPQNLDPTDPSWLTGPADRKFIVPDPDGEGITFTASQMLDTKVAPLNYTYQDTSDPLAGSTRKKVRLTGLRLLSDAPMVNFLENKSAGGQVATELLGANASTIKLAGGVSQTRVTLDKASADKVNNSFESVKLFSATPKEPDRVYLNLENIRGENDAAVFYVYVNVPNGDDPKDHPENKVGVLSLFGVSDASKTDSPHGGAGITQVFEITSIVDNLQLDESQLSDTLQVQFVARNTVKPEHDITVERVSVFRESL